MMHRIGDLKSKGWVIQFDGRYVKVAPPKEIREAVGYVEDVTLFSGTTFDAAIAFAEGFGAGFQVCKERAKRNA